MSTYSTKLKDPRWQKKRLEIFDRDQWTCKACGSTKDTLHVHHKEYAWGEEPWEYDDDNFVTLCEGCHSFEEELKKIPYYNDISTAGGFTNVKMWLFMNSVVYLKVSKPNAYEELRDLLNKNIFEDPVMQKDFSKFVGNPVEYVKTING